MSGTHNIYAPLLHERVHIALIGAGGNGAQMLTGLARLHLAMRARGHPAGLHVTTYDPDNVSVANVGRQLFSPSDVGLNKAVVLTHRLNCFYGLDWEARPRRFDGVRAPNRYDRYEIVVSCVDSAASRREIHRLIEERDFATPRYWLDLGNQRMDGQVIFGEPRRAVHVGESHEADFAADFAEGKMRKRSRLPERLPTVVEEFPELLDASLLEDDTPSCSLAESLTKQGLFINDHVSRWALHLLETLFRQGHIVHRGYYINLESGRVNPIPVKTQEGD